MAKMSKWLQSGELFQDPPSRPEAPRSAELQQNKQTAAEGCSFSESIKNDAFCKVFASVAASISGKRANGCRVVRFLRYTGVRTKTATRSVKMRGRRPNAPQDKAVKNLQFLAVFELIFSTVPQNSLNTMCFEGFMKIVFFAPTCSTTSPSPKCCKNLVFYEAFSWSRSKPHAIQDNIVFIKSSPLSSESFILMFFVLNSRSFFDEFDL